MIKIEVRMLSIFTFLLYFSLSNFIYPSIWLTTSSTYRYTPIQLLRFNIAAVPKSKTGMSGQTANTKDGGYQSNFDWYILAYIVKNTIFDNCSIHRRTSMPRIPLFLNLIILNTLIRI